VYIHTPLPESQFCNLDAKAKDGKHNKDYYRNLLTDEGTSPGQYTICCVLMLLTPIVLMRAVY